MTPSVPTAEATKM